MSKFSIGSYVAWAWDKAYTGIIIDICERTHKEDGGTTVTEICYQIRWNNHITKEFCDEIELVLLSEGKNVEKKEESAGH